MGTYLEITIRSDAESVARTTKVVRHTVVSKKRESSETCPLNILRCVGGGDKADDSPCDEADGALMAGHAPVFGGVVGIVAVGHALESGELGLDGVYEIAVRYELSHLPLVAVERHVLSKSNPSRWEGQYRRKDGMQDLPGQGRTYLDESNGDGLVLGKAHKVEHVLGVVETLDDDDVNLDTLHAEFERPVDAVEYRLVASSPRHKLELEWIERVEADVQMRQAVLDERVELSPAERDAVGGDANLFEAVLLERRERRDDLGQVGPHCRLAASQPDLVDTLANK